MVRRWITRAWLLYPKWFRTKYIGSLKVDGVATMVLVGILLLGGIAWLLSDFFVWEADVHGRQGQLLFHRS
jgi:hypothetical protein